MSTPAFYAFATELILSIVELALDDLAASSYQERQELLRSLCITSKHLCQVARPLLWQEVCINQSTSAASVLQQAPRFGRYTKTLCVALNGDTDDVEGFFAAVEELPSLVSMHVHRLALAGVTLTAPLPACPHLVALSLSNWTSIDPAHRTCFTTDRYPSLRSLRIEHPYDLDREITPTRLAFSRNFLAQLALHSVGPTSHNPTQLRATPAVLQYQIPAVQFTHLKPQLTVGSLFRGRRLVLPDVNWIAMDWTAPSDRHVKLLEALERAVEDSFSSIDRGGEGQGPVGLVLPHFLRSFSSPSSAPSVSPAVERRQATMRDIAGRLARLCEKRGVPVFWQPARPIGAMSSFPDEEVLDVAVRALDLRRCAEL
ncbi:hypothetical protein JCM10207_006357 [Rhodosporidiobolus poonsookiae]